MPDANDFLEFSKNLVLDEAFVTSSEEEQQELLKRTRDLFKSQNPDAAFQIDQAAEDINKRYRIASGQGRYIPKDLSFVDAPWQKEGFNELSEEAKVEQIEQFRGQIPSQSSKADSINREDTEFFLNQVTNHQKRNAQGENTGAIEDTGWRMFDGFAGGLASYMGAQETADDIKAWSEENPKYDERFSSMLYQGVGDLAASTAVFLGATALSGGNVAVGTATLLGTNGIMRYNDAYKQAIEKGLDKETAHEAGIFALPGAMVDTLGDRLIAGKFLPTNYSKVLATGSELAKKQALADILKDTTLRGMTMKLARDGFVEGITESAGDYTSGFGAYIATNEEEFVPTTEQSVDSFLVGAILGGGVSGAMSVKDRSKNKEMAEVFDKNIQQSQQEEISEQEAAAEVNRLVREGKFGEAAAYAKSVKLKGGQDLSESFNPDILLGNDMPVTEEQAEQFESEPDTAGKRKALDKALEEEFKAGVESQLAHYNPANLSPALSQQPTPTTNAPLDIRQGTLESGNEQLVHFETPVRDWVTKITNDYSNIDLVDPASNTPSIKRADFNTLSRSKTEGDFTVQGSPELATKVEEELATGKKDLFLIAPVDPKQDQELGTKIDRADISGLEITPYEDGSGNQVSITTEEGLSSLIDQLNTRYGGPENWVVKDSLGAASQGIYINESGLREAFQEEGSIDVTGFYAETFNNEVFDKNAEFRVHVVKRNGKLEVVPFATHPKTNILPYVARTDDILNVENIALAKAEAAIDQVAENGLLGVDVTRSRTGVYTASELNPTQVGDRATELNAFGESGYVSTPYVNAALYSHLKGRVPAFVLVARPILRNKAAVEFQVKGISENITRVYQNVRDRVALKRELIRAYGERFGDRANEIWDALRAGMGRVTQRLNDIIRSIITQATPAEVSVSEENQGVLNETQNAVNNATQEARKATEKRKARNQKPAEELNETFDYNTPDDSVTNPYIQFREFSNPAFAQGRSSRYMFYDGRLVTVVNVNGVDIPFYRSSGAAPKDNVIPGQWYPIFGIGPSGWINKGTADGISSYYNIPQLKAVSEYLNRTVKQNVWATQFDDIGAVINPFVNKLGIQPIDNGTSYETLVESINKVANALSVPIDNLIYNVPIDPSIQNKSLLPEEVQAIVDELTGGSSNIKVVSDINLPWAGRITRRRDIELNAARLTSVEQAREVLIEEAIHAVWGDADIQDAWTGIKMMATRDEVLALQAHYKEHGVDISYSMALEEWANQEVRRQYLQQQGPVRSFVDRVWQKIKETFGLTAPSNASDASRIMSRALEYLSEETIKNARLKPSTHAGAYEFENGQIAGPSKFYILAHHSTPNDFDPTDQNPLGQFRMDKMSTGEGTQFFGWGMYLGSSARARNAYREQFSKNVSGWMDVGYNLSIEGNLLKNKSKLFEIGGLKNLLFAQNFRQDGLFQALQISQDALRGKGTTHSVRLMILNYLHSQTASSSFEPWIFKRELDFYQQHDGRMKQMVKKLDLAADEFNRIAGYDSMMGHIVYSFTPEAIAAELEWMSKNIQSEARTLKVRLNFTPDKMLFWDGSFEEQSPYVRAILEKNWNSFADDQFLADVERLSSGFWDNAENLVFTQNTGFTFASTLYKTFERKFGSPENASKMLERMGIYGIDHLDGGSRKSRAGTSNYVVFNPARMEILDREGSGTPLQSLSPDFTLKADQTMYNIPLPPRSVTAETRSKDKKVRKAALKKRDDQNKRFNKLKRLQIDDRFDGNTQALVTLLRGIKGSELKMLQDSHIDDFYDLIDHIYQARSSSVTTPDLRDDSQDLIDELQRYKFLLDAAFINNTVKEFGNLVDFSLFPKETMADRDLFTSLFNKTMKENDLDVSKQSPANKKRHEKKQAEWRKKFNEGREDFMINYPTAESWISDIEALAGTPFKSKTFRNFLDLHYTYMTQVADVGAMEGKELYHHFFELNNMRDGQTIYPFETSVPWVAGDRDSKINISFLTGKFRDPVIMRNKFLEGLDRAQKFTELKQSQLDRFSSFTEAKDFLQQDLMGPLLETILSESANNQFNSRKRYDEAKKAFEKNVKRKVNGDDNVMMSITSRLIQFQAGKNPNAEFLRNLENERKAIYNIIGNPATNTKGRGSEALKREYRDTILPILEYLTLDLENSATPMTDFMASINERMGRGDKALGRQRSLLLNQMQNIMGEYSLDMQFVSEAFYKKPFKRFMNYLPRRAIPLDPDKTNTREDTLKQEIDKFDDRQYQSNSVTTETEQLKERTQIGENAHYSNNIEYIFERGIRIASLTGSTTHERFILDQRLRKGGEMANMIEGSNSSYRTDQLRAWSVSLFQNAMHSGNPLGSIGVVMKRLNEMYARVALSGLHQGVTQTISGFSDYHIRTGNIEGAMQAAAFLINNREVMNAWFEANASRISERSLLGEQELNRQRSPSFSESQLKNNPAIKKLEQYYEGATKIITFSLRQGDDFTAKSLVFAEYVRLLKEKGHVIDNMNDVDLSMPEGQIITQAMLNVERNINSSDKITRGELFTDRTAGLSLVRNISLAFSSHTMTLAAQFNIAVRDLIDLKAQGAGRDAMASQIRTIGAILTQSFMFSSSRFLINASLATAMIAMLQSLFDDEEGKLTELEEKLAAARKNGDDGMIQAAENELAAAKAVRKAINAFDSRNRSFKSYYQGVLKDELGSIHFAFGGPGLPQKAIFMVADNFGEKMHKESIKDESLKIQNKIDAATKAKRFNEVAKLKEQKFLIDTAEFLPLNIEQFGNIGLGGITGSALSATYASFKEFNNAAFGLTEINWNDFVIAAQSAGLGQADINKFLKTVDKIEDDMFKRGNKNEENMEKAQTREAEQKERARKRRLQALLRSME